MRVVSIAVIVLAFALPARGQGGPYGSVKTFSGSVSLQAVHEVRGENGYLFKESVQAEGPVTISDELLPNGMHATWPMVSPANPTAAGQGWRVRTSYSSSKSENGNGAAMPGTKVSCGTTEDATWGVALAAPAGLGKYVLVITPKGFKAVLCTGTEQGMNVNTTESLSPLEEVRLEGRAPGPVSGGETVTVGDWKVTVKYSLSPGR